MGASISMASGVARSTGERTVAYIGDSTFFHSGLPALVNAVQADDPVTVCVLNNYVTAMTGFQPSPAVRDVVLDASAQEMGSLIEKAVRGLGVEQVYSVDPYDTETTIQVLRKAREAAGVNVVILNSPCRILQNRVTTGRAEPPYLVDQELCDECSLCVRVLGCPGITVTDGKYDIDQELCDGCGICAYVCNKDAISQAGGNVQG
jgi:indolepyruvate ferredoxin oxidoreductase alpha subunit